MGRAEALRTPKMEVRVWMEVWGWMGARGKAGVAMSIPASLATLSALTICLL